MSAGAATGGRAAHLRRAREGSAGRRASRGAGCAGCVRDAHPCTWGAAAGAHTVCDLRVQSGAPPHPPPAPPAQRGAPPSGPARRLFCPGWGAESLLPRVRARSPNWGPGWDFPFLLVLVGAARVGVGEPPRWRRVAASRPRSTAPLAAAAPLWRPTRQRLPHLPRVRGVPRARGRNGNSPSPGQRAGSSLWNFFPPCSHPAPVPSSVVAPRHGPALSRPRGWGPLWGPR